MNPYSFHVELYHEKISKKHDPRDILIPSSIPSKSRKLHSAIKFLGGLTASKAGLVVVGGILAVGCTVRALRNRRRRLHEKRNALRAENAGCSQIEVGTQTDSLSDLPDMKGEEVQKDSGHDQLASNLRKEAVPAHDFIANKFPSPETHEVLHPSQSNDAAKLSRVCRNFSDVTEVSDDSEVSKCDCASKNGATVIAARAAQPHHSCCHLSAFIALLALHKASMCERGARVNNLSEAKPEGRTTNYHVDNVAKPSTSVAGKPQHSAFSNTDEAQSPKKPQSRGPWETSYPLSDKFDAREGETNEAKRSESSSSEFTSNPFDIQVQPNSSQTTGPGKQGGPRFKAGSSFPRAQPSNRGRGFKSNLSTSRGGSTNQVAPNCFEQIEEVEKPACSKTNNKRIEGRNSSAAFRPRRYGKSGDSGKPRRRGNGRQNLPRRPYVDLDDPKPIASQHQRQ